MRWLTLALITSLASGCADLEVTDEETAALAIVGAPASDGEMPRGSYVITPRPPGISMPAAAGAQNIIYLNFDGGSFSPGWDDSSRNVSSIVDQTSSVPPWGTAQQRAAVESCVTEQFSRFNVIVTSDDPGEVPHVESVVAGSPGHVGMPNGVGGVSPFSCGVIDRSIVFTFAEIYGPYTRDICEVAAQEIAHSYGLDHEYLCEDPMTYLNGCGEKEFRDEAPRCGEFSARDCQCGGATQNSVQRLLGALGPADTVAPTVAIAEPSDGATVVPGFEVVADATDDVGIAKVELFVDGVLAQTATTAPYSFDTDPTLSQGTHMIEVRAHDGKTYATDSIRIGVGEPPDGPVAPPDFGDSCTDNAQCESGLCATQRGDQFCTMECDPAADPACPDSFACAEAGPGMFVCGYADKGGCSTAGGRSAPGAGLWLLLAVALIAATARRSRRTR